MDVLSPTPRVPDPQPVKRLSPREFREIGLLQEINRRLLHPCGLALEVIIHSDGTHSLGSIWDYRDDPEGVVFGDKIDQDKARRVDALIEAHRVAREELFGSCIQPLTSDGLAGALKETEDEEC